MTHLPTPPRLRLQCPADVLAAIPYLLGFHPADSLVVLGLREAALVFHARCDLPVPAARSSEVLGLAAYLTQVLRNQKADGALLVGFGPPDRTDQTVRATADAMRGAGIMVFDQLRAMAGHYWSYLCRDPSCCPPEGIAYDVEGTVVAAEATLAGFVALRDREALVRTLGPPEGSALSLIRQETSAARDRLSQTPLCEIGDSGAAALRDAVDRYTLGSRMTDAELAWLTVLLATDRQLRDRALLMIDDAGTTLSSRTIQVALWTDVVRRCEPAMAVEPAVLLAYACWRSGDGIRSGVAVERARAIDPHSLSANLMEELLRRAVPPPLARDRRASHASGKPRRQRGKSRRSRAGT